ncbi:hypothetical protein DKX38_000075 [Salix brachista]|uniref:Uncharacterized protein n=1 Tax=Salix brachista TaxID=2182728 RepID=A0A5N5P260_9ROSI|nr:hypothetical protein DKX38_000075 [Salix brachista]
METDRICEEDGEKQVEAEMAVKISNYANVLLLVFKIYATAKTGSIAIAASTLDSLLDLTHISMSNVNNYEYPTGKLRTQPVGMIIFAAIMATLGSFVAPWIDSASCDVPIMNKRLADTSITEFLAREIPNFLNVFLILVTSKYFWSPKGFNLWLIHHQKSDARRTTMNMFL